MAHSKLENSSRDGNTRPPDRPLEKFVCRSKEVDQRYIANPLMSDDSDDVQEKESISFGSRSWGNHSGNSYGRSGVVKIERPKPRERVQVVAKRVPDSDFEPTPIMQLKTGQRIEHNRFGFGVIKEMTGSASDLKARINFDEHGEKILILKYAKIRVVQ